MKTLLSFIPVLFILLGLHGPSYMAVYANLDFEITNADNLDVLIDPPLRVTLYETAENISEGAKAAFIKAMSDHATARMQNFFTAKFGNEFDLDKVQFKALSVDAVSKRINRALTSEVTDKEVGGLRGSQSRDLQAEIYGTSFLLSGNFTFGSLPAAKSSLCNRKLQDQMTKYFSMEQEIRSQANSELIPIIGGGALLTEIVTASPTSSPTTSPTSSPTDSPTSSPTLAPTSFPTPVVTVGKTSAPTTKEPSPSPTISHAPNYTPPPTSLASESPSSSPNTEDDSILPILIPVAASLVFIAAGAGFYGKKRNDKKKAMERNNILLKPGAASDDSSEEFVQVDSASMTLTSTKEAGSGDAYSASSGSYSSKEVMDRSVATSVTMKTGNKAFTPGKFENKWVGDKSPTAESDLSSPAQLNDSSSSGSLFDGIVPGSPTTPTTVDFNGKDSDQKPPLPASATPKKTPGRNLSTIASPSPTTKSLFGAGKDSPNTSRRSLTASPITTVTPTKVSKEEFEKDWDENVPFNWKPTPTKSSGKKLIRSKSPSVTEISDAEIEGSFPTFGTISHPPVTQSASRANSSTFESSQSASDYNSASHPMDWSNKESEFECESSVGASTYTDGDSTGINPSEDFQWNGRVSGLNGDPVELASPTRNNYASPGSQTASRNSTVGSKSIGSTRSKGSSKQLINDIVWLEKKIADVRARVDRLDGEESDTTGSPMKSSFTSSINRSMGSPITANIVCRDVIAPAGKLQIIIHSTKDGPAIHSVKQGSVLEGKIFAGDLILSVNDIDTRTFDAEAVMELMSKSSDGERRLTVLHAM